MQCTYSAGFSLTIAIFGLQELEALNDDTREELISKLALRAASGNTIIHRHVVDGDWCLLNRQPTLHRNSMLAHRIRVLSHARTFRFHYANCKGYNADFDGDEMNVHIPQSLQAQAEAKMITNADRNYIVPTSGKPIRGLMQDVVSMGVLMTRNDCFFSRGDYMALIYHAVHPYTDDRHVDETHFVLPPAIILPKSPHGRQMLWTGKQVHSTLRSPTERFGTPYATQHTTSAATPTPDDMQMLRHTVSCATSQCTGTPHCTT